MKQLLEIFQSKNYTDDGDKTRTRCTVQAPRHIDITGITTASKARVFP
jgi:hypothetical protein